jgi:hypothetical protein
VEVVAGLDIPVNLVVLVHLAFFTYFVSN